MRYEIWDVFADHSLAGNALAVVFDGGRLGSDTRARLARWFALSETVFIDDRDAEPRLWIHTPTVELPVAGHPTIGAAFALHRAGAFDPPDRSEERPRHATVHTALGPVALRFDHGDNGRLRRVWMDQGRPRRLARMAARSDAAAAFGLEIEDLHPSLPLEVWSAGNPFLLVPLASDEALGRAVAPHELRLPQLDPAHRAAFLFVPEAKERRVRARMFGASLGVVEDPGTGSAHGPLGAYLAFHAQLAVPREGPPATLTSTQGEALGRVSRIEVEVRTSDADDAGDASDDAPGYRVHVGGHAVRSAEGTLNLSDEESVT